MVQNTLIIPTYAAGVSAIILVCQLLVVSKSIRTLRAKLSSTFVSADGDGTDHAEPVLEGTSHLSGFTQHIRQLGGSAIFAFKFVRFLSCLVLLCLSVLAMVSEEHKRSGPGLTRPHDWSQIGVCGLYVSVQSELKDTLLNQQQQGYASLLAIATMTAKPWLSRLISRHLALVLFLSWAVYVYRDIWPLATFTLAPVDAAEGGILWVKIALLTVAAVVVPLCMPRQYIPLNPKVRHGDAQSQPSFCLSALIGSNTTNSRADGFDTVIGPLYLARRGCLRGLSHASSLLRSASSLG